MSLINELKNEVLNEAQKKVVWPDVFVNSETGKEFVPQNEEIFHHIFETDKPKHLYIRSGEGGGKTCSLAILTLNKLRRGMSGAFCCVDLPMLIKVWSEFKLWIPPECVIPEHRHMLAEAWTPYRSIFQIVFYAETGGYSKLIVGGLGDDYGRWESLNISHFIFDEARHIPKDKIMKVATGRIRIDGPNGEPPQLVIGSTPTDETHWLFDYFGPESDDDELWIKEFKKYSKVIQLSVEENLHNLNADYMKDRALTLTEAERRIFIDGQWGTSYDEAKFLEDINLWNKLYDKELNLPRTKNSNERDWSDMLVIALDGAIKNDSFGMAAVSRHPKNRDHLAVRLTKEFKPKNKKIDFAQVEATIREWCGKYNILTIVFDIYQIYDMTERLKKEGLAWFQEFSQQHKRTLADNFLYEVIRQERIYHMNQADLYENIKRAGYKYDTLERKRRITKIRDAYKVDILQCVAMAAWECNRLNI